MPMTTRSDMRKFDETLKTLISQDKREKRNLKMANSMKLFYMQIKRDFPSIPRSAYVFARKRK